jgi:cellobiose phosphorylase
MTRPFRGATYQIDIRKKKGICKGKVTLTLDGKELRGNLLPIPQDGGMHKVVARVERDGGLGQCTLSGPPSWNVRI